MPQSRLKQVFDQHAACIEACLNLKGITASLVLIHTGIDTVGWLDSAQQYNARSTYMRWADEYLLKAKPLGCTSLDLYVARCGLLHTLTAESELRDKGRAKRFCYSHSGAKVSEIRRLIRRAKMGKDWVPVDIHDLFNAWRVGVQASTTRAVRTFWKSCGRSSKTRHCARSRGSRLGKTKTSWRCPIPPITPHVQTHSSRIS